MNWKILGIEPTKDKETIVAAYRAQLSHTNPEDDPEAFKALRAAYEEALELAKKPDEEPSRDDSPVGLWMEKVRAVYGDFPRRINPECWAELLADDVCAALDTRPLAEEALLNFLMQDFYLPQSVWQELDRAFFWQERREELYESYPRDFVDYAVINGIRYPGNLPYEYFTPGISAEDCDQYRRLYYSANQSDAAERASLLQQMEALSESHPYGELLRWVLMLDEGDEAAALEGIKGLAERYPEDAKLQLEWAAKCMDRENWSEAEECCRKALALRPSAAQPRQMLAVCLGNMGRYEQAKKLVFQLMDAAGGDRKRIHELRALLMGWNEALIAEFEAGIAASPEDMELKSKLAWCYLQNDRDADALELCRSLTPTYGNDYDYHNLLSKVFYSVEDFEASVTHLQAVVQLMQTMVPDGTDETAEIINSLPEKLQLLGSCLMRLGRSDEAMEKYEQALELAPENPEVLTNMGHLLVNLGRQQRAAEMFRKLTEVMPGAYHGFYLLARCLYALGQDRDAFEAVNRAQELEGGDLGVYVLKMQILLRNGAWEAVREILDFLHRNGIEDEIYTLWCEARLLEQGEGNKEKALELYRAIAARVENGESLDEAAALYFRLLCLEAEHLDANKPEDRAVMLALAEKGLSHDPDDFACLDYKAWLLKRDGQRQEALSLYHRLEAVPRRTLGVEQELAELYYKDLSLDADKALHYYKLLLEQNESTTFLFYAGTCCRYLGLYEEGERCFLRLQELDPDDVDGYNGLSHIYDCAKRYEDALLQVNKVIELSRDWEGDQSKFHYHKVRILRRLERPEEAMAVIDEITEKYGNDDAFREKFDICCQFGLWEKAEGLLEQWRQSGRDKKGLDAAAIDLEIFRGNIDEAKAALESLELRAYDAERLKLLMGELFGDEAAQMKIWNKRSSKADDNTHELVNMAQVQWWSGHFDKAQEYAAEALQKLEELILRNKRYEALYRSRKAMALAILGRVEEAYAELSAVRQLPLCESCNYCLCKDADIFEANIREVCGDFEQALEMHRKGAERWPDDADFRSGARRMMRKGL